MSITSLLVVLACLVAPPVEDRPPNVILIMADDLGLAELGCTGGTRIRTPNIDALRERGMLFTDAYSGSTVCAPSRCTLITGRHTGHAQIRDNGETPNLTGPPEDPDTRTIGGWQVPPEPRGLWGGQRSLEPGTETLARVLHRNGYATCGVGKWGLGGPGSVGHPNRQGFDHWYGYLCQRNAHNYYPTYLMRNDERVRLEGNERGLTGRQYATDLMADEAFEFVRAHRDGPFFLYYATPVPHLALQVPEDSLAEYRGLWEDPPYPGGRGYLPHPEPRAAYAAMVTRFDRDVGRLVALLEELGLADDTVIMLTSDNGSTFDLGGYDPEFFQGTGGLRGAKTWMHEGGIRVPLIATWPGHIAPDSTSDLTVANWDLYPTVLGLAGIEPTTTLDGIDLAPVMLGTGPAAPRDHLYWEFHSRGGMQAVRMGRWKGLRSDAHADADAPIELFDLENDPAETTDVAGEHPEVVEAIAERMRSSRTVSPVPGWNFGPEARGERAPSDPAAPAVTRTWTGAGDGASFDDPANWSGEGEIRLDALVDVFRVDDADAVLGKGGVCPTLTFDGGGLDLRFGGLLGSGQGIRNARILLTNGILDRQFLLASEVTIDGQGILRLHGGGDPLNRSRVDLLDTRARIIFISETPDDVREEHLRKITVKGEPAQIDGNVRLEPHGDGGGTVVRPRGGADE